MPQLSAEQYDAWYRTPRGAWIGEAEFRLLAGMLGPRPGETLLDVGCGTGYFTRRFSRDAEVMATGVDPDEERLLLARSGSESRFVRGTAESLPFPDRSFDLAVSVTALCFVADERKALAEMLRITRRRFAVGLLNRESLLYREKAGRGAYAGARWHTPGEARGLLSGLGLRAVEFGSAVFLPGASLWSRAAERILPGSLLKGALLAFATDAR